jgi:hypothetical protein
MAAGIADAIGGIPYRLALAGGWIDQPFVSERNPSPPGSMTVVSVEPEFRFMDYAGMATSTRKVAARLGGRALPARPPADLVRELYAEENRGKNDPSGAQDMVGLIYPGIVRMDFDAAGNGGVFPARVESCIDPDVAAWVERRIRILPVNQRPQGYNPLVAKRIEPGWVKRLGDSGRACYLSIVARDLAGLQASMNECMLAWEALLPATLRDSLIPLDLAGLLGHYRDAYGGAMYSGCGGGYLFVATDRDVPGSFGVRVRLPRQKGSRA